MPDDAIARLHHALRLAALGALRQSENKNTVLFILLKMKN
jgi:hypothetical protein